MSRTNALLLLLFASLSLLMTWEGWAEDGYFSYRDESPVLTTPAYREYFFSLMKNNNVPDIDMQKRMPLHILNLLVPDGIFERLKFPVPAFLAFASFFYAAMMILESGGMKGRAQQAVAAFGALAYVINPITTQLILSFYPMLVFAAFPVFFLLLYEGICTHSRPKVFASALLASFMVLMVVHSALYVGIAFLSLAPAIVRRRKDALRIAGSLALFGAVLLSCLLFVILPYTALFEADSAPRGAFQPTKSDLDMFSAVAWLPRPMLLDFNSFWWPYVQYAYPMGNAFYAMMAMLMCALLCFAVFERSEWGVMPLIALAALFFLAKGVEEPFAWLYQTMVFKAPLGWLLRVPMKFMHIVPFFVSIIAVRFLAWALQKSAPAAAVLAGLTLVFLAASSWPLFSGDAAGVLEKSADPTGAYCALDAAFGGTHPAVLSAAGFPPNSVPGDISYGRRYLAGELDAYDSLEAWEGLSTFASAGFQYAIVPASSSDFMPGAFERVWRGRWASAFRLKNDSVPFSVSSSAYACYSSYMGLRSLQQDPPEGHAPAVAFFPYLSPRFPAVAIAGADHVLIDSTSPMVAATQGGSVFAFPEEGGWKSPGGTSLDKTSFYGHSFGTSFLASKSAKALPEGFDGPGLGAESLSFRIRDGITSRDGALSFSVPPGSEGESLAVAELPIQPAFHYTALISASGSARNASCAIAFLNAEGKVFSVVRLFNESGAFNTSAARDFYVPKPAKRALIYVSAYPSVGGLEYEITGFSLAPVIPPDAPASTATISVPEDGEYSVYIRHYEGKSAGLMAASMDGVPAFFIRTLSGSDHIVWTRVFSGRLAEGEHNITILNLGGYNAVNIGYAVPGGPDEDPFAGKTVVYRLVAKSDFESADDSVIVRPDASAFAYVPASSPLQAEIYVVSPSEYRLSSSAEGGVSVSIDGEEAGGSVYLDKGPHDVKVSPVSGSPLVDHVTLFREGTAEPARAEITSYRRVDPSTYALEVESSGPFYLSMARDFSKGWVAEAGGRIYKPVPSFGSITAFYINETGNTKINVYYEPQGLMLLGIGVGAAGLAICAALALRGRCCDRAEDKRSHSGKGLGKDAGQVH